MNTILSLQESGVDTEGALRRFSGNSILYERFLKKFLSDSTFGDLTKAFETGDAQAAMDAAHTLKGLTANLGFTKLFTITSEMVDFLRRNKFSEASGRYPELQDAYHDMCAILLKA